MSSADWLATKRDEAEIAARTITPQQEMFA